MKVKKMFLQKLLLILYNMKKIISLILLSVIVISCSKNREIKAENFQFITWNQSNDSSEVKKIEQIRLLLNDNENKTDENKTTVIKTDTKINKEEKTSVITPENNSETWILTEEEINIIENTTDWEIDQLIDIIFKDLN